MNYDDIINIEWPQETLRPKMPVSQRAKIFLPFAALRGYEESLDNRRNQNETDFVQKTTLFVEDLSEEELASLSAGDK